MPALILARDPFRLFRSVCVASLTLLTASLCAQSPELTGAIPVSVRPGETTTITWHGANLLKPLTLWTSFGASNAWAKSAVGKDGKPIPADPKKAVSHLTVPADAPPGVGMVRLATDSGLSAPLFVLVDDLPVAERARANHSSAQAHALKLPSAVAGNTDAGRAEYFQLTLQAGERIAAEVFAARLLSKCDPMLRLLDTRGTELAFADDTPGLAGDCCISYRATVAGPVILEIRDVAWLGAADRFYHLRIGDFPLAHTAYPPAASPGANLAAQAIATGSHPGSGVPLTAKASRIPGESVPVPVRFAPGKPAAVVPVLAEPLPLQLEKEPNDSPSQATAVRPPVAIYGQLTPPGDRDTFRFEAKKDTLFTLTPVTRILGSPARLYLVINDSKGAFLSANDTAAAQTGPESPLTFRAPADGEYLLSISELTRRGGPEFTYGLRLEPAEPGFDLTVTGDRFATSLGGSFTVKISAQRRGASGPIRLALASADGQSLPDGFTLSDNVIESGKTETALKITAPALAVAGSIHHLAIVGHASVGTNKFTALARQPAPNPANAKDPLLPLLTLPAIPRLLRESIAVCVGITVPDFFAVSLPGGTVDLPRLVGRSSFTVSQKSLTKDFLSLVKLSFEGLPKDIAIAVQTPKATKTGSADFRCDITGLAESLGTGKTFTIVATGEHKGITREVRLTNVVLRAIEPLAVSAKPAGALKPGGKQTLLVTLTRHGAAADASPVSLRLLQLPPGLAAPASVTVPADKSTAEFELTAASTIVPGKLDGLRVAATAKIRGQEVKVESAALTLEVIK